MKVESRLSGNFCCCSDTLEPPADVDSLQIAYEAGLWQLLELFFLSDDTQEGFFAEAFSAWLAEHGGLLCSTPGYNTLAAAARDLGASARVDTEPSYWPTVQQLVLLGQLQAAADLLMAHPAYLHLQDPGMAAKVTICMASTSSGMHINTKGTSHTCTCLRRNYAALFWCACNRCPSLSTAG